MTDGTEGITRACLAFKAKKMNNPLSQTNHQYKALGCEMGSDPCKTLMQHTHMLQQQQRRHKGACLFLQDLITLRLGKKIPIL
jgi:hypothetical protein